MINIVGLGATDKNGLTLEAVEIIRDENPNYLRTKEHEAVKYFEENGIKYKSFDYMYNEKSSFKEVYTSIVNELLELEKNRDINYFVPGNPLIAERTVVELINSGVKYNIIMGTSFIEPVLRAVKRDPSEGFVLLDGDKFNKYDVDVHSDVIVTQIYNRRTASELKLDISEIYGDEYMVYLITDAGLPSEDIYYVPIYELDRIENINHQSAVYIPKAENLTNLSDLLSKIDSYISENSIDIDIFKNIKIDIKDEECLSEFLNVVLIALKCSDYEGFSNFYEIIAKANKKIAENGDFIKNTMEKLKHLGYNCDSL